MRRSEKEITDQSEINKILTQEKICRIAMIDNGFPYIVPMNFGYENGIFYFHSSHKGRKISILKCNPSACIEVESGCKVIEGEKPCNWGMRYMSIIAEGQVTFLENIDEINFALNIIMKKYAGRNDFVFDSSSITSVLVWSVKIEKISGKISGY